MATKVALVTASSAGLGAAIAKTLAAEMRVVINYSSNADRATAVRQELESIAKTSKEHPHETQDKPSFATIRADLSSKADIERLVKETVETMGRLDVVVSNGGWTRMRTFDDLDQNVDEDDWDRCFNVNVKSHMFLLHAARRFLDESKGSFVTIASVAGVKASGSSIPYSVSKAAQIHMVKGLARAVSPHITVNSVSPGTLMTDWGRSFPEEKLEADRNATLLKRFATVEDVAEAVKMVVKNKSLTGQNIVVDSGFSI
ncbi:hypothetical protein BJX99DRAFT_262966 [Aspergillus californicus]